MTSKRAKTVRELLEERKQTSCLKKPHLALPQKDLCSEATKLEKLILPSLEETQQQTTLPGILSKPSSSIVVQHKKQAHPVVSTICMPHVSEEDTEKKSTHSQPSYNSLTTTAHQHHDISDNASRLELPRRKRKRFLDTSNLSQSCSSLTQSDEEIRIKPGYLTRKKSKKTTTLSISSKTLPPKSNGVSISLPPKTEIDPKVWDMAYLQDKIMPFDYASCGSKLGSNIGVTECDTFRQFLTPTIVNHIVKSTNNFAIDQITRNSRQNPEDKVQNWKPVDAYEIEAFLGLFMLQGLVRKKSIPSYWSTGYVGTPVFSETMTKNRFEDIKRYFHLNAKGEDKIDKFTQMLIRNWQAAYNCSRELSLDESMMGFKGKTRMKQYQKLKPKKEGLMAIALSEAKTGYCINWKLYRGKGYIPDRPSEDNNTTVLKLLEPVKNLGHHVIMDSAYVCPDLLHQLASELQTGAYGTIRMNRKFLPLKIKEATAKKGRKVTDTDKSRDVRYIAWPKGKKKMFAHYQNLAKKEEKRKSKTGIILPKWFNRETTEVVRLASNITNFKMDPITKRPCLLEMYNFYKGGVDLTNQRMVYYLNIHRTRKWWIRVFAYLLEITYHNSYILWRKEHPQKVAHYSNKSSSLYRLKVIRGLLAAQRMRFSGIPPNIGLSVGLQEIMGNVLYTGEPGHNYQALAAQKSKNHKKSHKLSIKTNNIKTQTETAFSNPILIQHTTHEEAKKKHPPLCTQFVKVYPPRKTYQLEMNAAPLATFTVAQPSITTTQAKDEKKKRQRICNRVYNSTFTFIRSKDLCLRVVSAAIQRRQSK